MYQLRYIEDPTAPPEEGILLGLHPDDMSAYLALVFCDGRMPGVYVMDKAGNIVMADILAKKTFHLTSTLVRLQAVTA